MLERWDWYGRPHFQYVLIPDYSETESRIIVVASHMMLDGIAAFSFLKAASPDKDFSGFPPMAPVPFYKKFFCYLIGPISYIQYALSTLEFKER